MPTRLLVLAQSSSGGGSGGGAAAAGLGLFFLFYIALIIFFIATFWKIFTKAGQPGWAAIVPFYNMYIWCKIVGRPGWWIVLMFIPVVSLVIGIILVLDLAKSFGKGIGFSLGMIFLSFIFYPILAWGSAEYQGPAAGH
jgi:hypothetical protein